MLFEIQHTKSYGGKWNIRFCGILLKKIVMILFRFRLHIIPSQSVMTWLFLCQRPNIKHKFKCSHALCAVLQTCKLQIKARAHYRNRILYFLYKISFLYNFYLMYSVCAYHDESPLRQWVCFCKIFLLLLENRIKHLDFINIFIRTPSVLHKMFLPRGLKFRATAIFISSHDNMTNSTIIWFIMMFITVHPMTAKSFQNWPL